MRNIFAKNITDDKNPVYDGEAAFLRQRVPEYQQAQLEQQADTMIGTAKKMICWPVLVGQGLLAIAGLGCLRAFLDMWLPEEGTGTVRWPLVAIFTACAAGFGLLEWYSRRRTKQIEESDEYQMNEQQVAAAADTSRALLGVPADAADIEVLGYDYKIKKDKEKRTDSDWDYDTCCFYAFVQEGELLLADSVDKFAIPLAAVTAVRLRQKKAKVWLWMKDDSPKSDTYKPYQVKYDEDSDVYTLPAVYVLEIAHGGETYELLLPAYEWDRVLQPLVGDRLPAPTEE